MLKQLVKLAAGAYIAHTIRDLQLEREHLQSKLRAEREYGVQLARKAAEQRLRAEKAERERDRVRGEQAGGSRYGARCGKALRIIDEFEYGLDRNATALGTLAAVRDALRGLDQVPLAPDTSDT